MPWTSWGKYSFLYNNIMLWVSADTKRPLLFIWKTHLLKVWIQVSRPIIQDQLFISFKRRTCQGLGMNTYKCIQGWDFVLATAVPLVPIRTSQNKSLRNASHLDVSFSIGSLLSHGTFASCLVRVSIWTVSILLPPPHPRRTPSFWNAGAGMSWVLYEILPNYLIFKGEDAPSFSSLRQLCSVDQWAWPTQSSCVAPLPPLKEKTVSIHSISSYHNLARIQETKSTGKEVGVAEPPSGS